MPVIYAGRVTPGRIGSIVMSTTMSQTHTMSNEITDFPIEDGSKISDHIKNQPRTVSIEGVISSYDLPEAPVTFDLNRAELAYQALEKLFADRLPVDIETSIKFYPGMGIENIEVKRDANTGEALFFTLTAKEIKRTTLFKTQILNVARAPRIESKAQKKADTGKQEAATVAEDKGSMLYRLTGGK